MALSRRSGRTEVSNTVTTGTNATLIAEAARLYLRDGDMVADVTYGTGIFWRLTDTSRLTLLRSDVEPRAPGVIAADCRALPYRDASADVVVLDPPYLPSAGGGHLSDHRYNNARTTARMRNREILHDLYRPALAEARRVLRPGGLAWVKGQNLNASGVQCWNDIALHEIAAGLGFSARDKFLFIRKRALPARGVQRTAHKRDSFLWVFESRNRLPDYISRDRRWLDLGETLRALPSVRRRHQRGRARPLRLRARGYPLLWPEDLPSSDPRCRAERYPVERQRPGLFLTGSLPRTKQAES